MPKASDWTFGGIDVGKNVFLVIVSARKVHVLYSFLCSENLTMVITINVLFCLTARSGSNIEREYSSFHTPR